MVDLEKVVEEQDRLIDRLFNLYSQSVISASYHGANSAWYHEREREEIAKEIEQLKKR